MEIETTTTISGQENLVFLPSSISILVLNAAPEISFDVQYGLGVEVRDISSVWVILYSFLELGDDRHEVQACESARYPLDYFTDIRKESVIQDESGNIVEIVYSYRRFDDYFSFEAILSGPGGIEELQAFDFLLGQYAIKDNFVDREILNVEEGNHPKQSNAVAKGFEKSGVIMRTVLKTSGEYTGHLIRFLGRKFTEATVDANRTSPPAVIDERVLQEARRRREWAEGFNSGARTLTSTILYPVRWTGQRAAKMAAVSASPDQQVTTVSANRRLSQDRQQNIPKRASFGSAVWETVEGMGNGVTSIFKGVTEAMAEVGNAIGDSAMHHAKAKYGEEYAQQITKSYVDAASEIGLAGYKVVNVLSFGIAGLMIDVVVEGTTLLVSLYDYLVGPILLQGFMLLVQPPLLTPQRYFVVLRPWSIAFYKSPRDITGKPHKIIPTFLLDTIPRLRLRRNVINSASSVSVIAAEDARAPITSVDGLDLTAEELAMLNSNTQGSNNTSRTNAGDDNAFSALHGAEMVSSVYPTQARTDVAPVSDNRTGGVRYLQEAEEINIIEAEGVSYIVVPPTASSAMTSTSTTANSVAFPADSATNSSNFQEGEEFLEVDALVSSVGTSSSVSAVSPHYNVSLSQPQPSATTPQSTRGTISNALYHWRGGHRSHIELTTIDCSTYLLYPETSIDASAATPDAAGVADTGSVDAGDTMERSENEALVRMWFAELETAVKRVETLAKRRSEAQEIALKRRLKALPKKRKLQLALKRFILLEKTLPPRTNPAAEQQVQPEQQAGGVGLSSIDLRMSSRDAVQLEEECSLSGSDKIMSPPPALMTMRRSKANDDGFENTVDDDEEYALQLRYMMLQGLSPAHPFEASSAFDSILSNEDQHLHYSLDDCFREEENRRIEQRRLALERSQDQHHQQCRSPLVDTCTALMAGSGLPDSGLLVPGQSTVYPNISVVDGYGGAYHLSATDTGGVQTNQPSEADAGTGSLNPSSSPTATATANASRKRRGFLPSNEVTVTMTPVVNKGTYWLLFACDLTSCGLMWCMDHGTLP